MNKTYIDFAKQGSKSIQRVQGQINDYGGQSFPIIEENQKNQQFGINKTIESKQILQSRNENFKLLLSGRTVNANNQSFFKQDRTQSTINVSSKKSLNKKLIQDVSQLLISAFNKLQIDVSKKPLNREDIIKLGKELKVHINQYQALEAIFFAQQYTQDPSNFNFLSLKDWFEKNLSILRSINNKNLLSKSALNQQSDQDFQGENFQTIKSNQKNLIYTQNQNKTTRQELSHHNGSRYSYDNRQQQFYADIGFKLHVFDTVKQLQKIPKLRKNIEIKLKDWERQREEQGAEEGLNGSLIARQQIRNYYRKIDENEKSMLDKFIQHETNACHANNLQRLLTKKWTEEPNAYKICSKLTPRKQKRIKDILVENRYS